MELRPVPISELRIGEFYDATSEKSVLLLKLLPNSEAEVLSMSMFQLTVTKTSLQTLYPYHTLSKPIHYIPSTSNGFLEEEKIEALSAELKRVLESNTWVFRFPHFCEGYLFLYFSYLKDGVKPPKHKERVTLGLNFVLSFFQTLLNHLIHAKPIAEEAKPWFIQVCSSLCNLVDDLCRNRYAYTVDNTLLATLNYAKVSVLHALCPADLPQELTKFWESCRSSSLQDILTLEFEGKLTVLNLLRTSPTTLTAIAENQGFYNAIKHSIFPTVLPADVVSIQLRIIALGIKANVLEVPCLITQNLSKLALKSSPYITLADLCKVFLEEELFKHSQYCKIMGINSFLLKRPELFPVVFQHLNSTASTEAKMSLEQFLICLTSRIAVHDLNFLNFVVANKVLTTKVSFHHKYLGEEIYSRFNQLVTAFWKQRIPTALLKDLFPPEDFGRYLFPKLAHNFSLAKTRKHMVEYFGSEENYWKVACGDVKRYTRAGVDLWYIFAGSNMIKFMWVRKHASRRTGRLSENLGREICGYLV